MSVPSLSELELAAKKVVWTAKEEDNLKRFTPRLVRATLEEQFHLDEGALDAPEYKSAIKTATKAALKEDPPAEEGEKSVGVEKSTSPVSSKKRKSDGTVKEEDSKKSSSSLKGKGKAKMVKESEDEEEEEDRSPKKRRKTVPEQKKKVVSDDDDEDKVPSSSRPKRRSAEKAFKSAELVPTSDMEQDEPDPQSTLKAEEPKVSASKGISKGGMSPKPDATPKGKMKTKKPNSGAKSGTVKKNKEEEGSPKRRRKTVPEKKKKVVSDDEDNDSVPTSSRPNRRQGEKAFKSAEHVATSDMEQDEPDAQPTLQDENPKSKGAVSPKTDATPQKSKNKEPNSQGRVDYSKIDSELSELTDEPPKQRQRSKSKSERKEPKKTKNKKEAPVLSKEEEKIKRLKSLVVACGVRKVWSKVFQGLESSRQQVKKLEEILAELGMHGRMSMEQARAIKEKRALAQELEDVQAFAKAVEGKGSGGRSRKAVKASSKIESSGSEDEKDNTDEDDEESDVGPKKRPMNARRSIMAFLEDQSSDE